MSKVLVNKDYLIGQSQEAYFFEKPFGHLASDGEGNSLFGFDTIAHPKKNKSVEVGKVGSGGCFSYVIEGAVSVKILGSYKQVSKGQWFSTKDNVLMRLATNTKIVVIQKAGFKGLDLIGQVEKDGRLGYIDGCTDSLLVHPIKLGYPCLNALYMPANIKQTMHTHPSSRMGCIFAGTGHAVTPEKEVALKPGILFWLKKEQLHHFRTDHSKDYMKIVAWHPDSDYGPKDNFHPMLNRTVVDGTSASKLDDIRTKEGDIPEETEVQF